MYMDTIQDQQKDKSYIEGTPGKLRHLKQGLSKYGMLYMHRQQNWKVGFFSKHPLVKLFYLWHFTYIVNNGYYKSFYIVI